MQKWKKTLPPAPPVISVSLSIDRQAYGELKLNPPKLVKRPGAGHARRRNATEDTGAQLTVMNIKELTGLGIKQNSIFQVETGVNTVTSSAVDIVGGVFLRISAYDEMRKQRRETRQLCYVSKSIQGIYLSEEACRALGTIPETFPQVGQFSTEEQMSISGVSSSTIKCTNSGVVGPDEKPCSCPKRSLPPTEKPKLPCEPTEENLPILKQYILDRYRSSGFNCCEHQPLPLMTDAKPVQSSWSWDPLDPPKYCVLQIVLGFLQIILRFFKHVSAFSVENGWRSNYLFLNENTI